MRNRFIRSIFALVAVLVFSPGILAQTAKPSGAAKAQTAAPTPDLSGVWIRREFRNTFDSKEDPPMQPWAEAKFKAVTREMDPTLSCFPQGVPRILLVPQPVEIVQIPGRVLMLFEWDHWVRHIYTDGRGHPKDPDPTWMGHSIGRWDGDTLVVDTVGLNDKTWLDYAGHPHSDALHVMERIRRVDHDTLLLDITIDDPKAYTKPWTGQKVYKLRPDWQIMETVLCEERLELGTR